MFGFGTGGQQQAAVEKFKQAMAPLDGGYVYRLKRDETVLLNEKQRDELLDYYARALKRSAWQTAVALTAGVLVSLAVSMLWHFGQHFWIVAIAIAIGLGPAFTIKYRIRRKIAEFGPLPLVAQQRVEALIQERLRKMPWSNLLAPGALVIVLALRMHPHLPPQGADDWAELALLLGLIALFVWAAVRKFRADETPPR